MNIALVLRTYHRLNLGTHTEFNSANASHQCNTYGTLARAKEMYISLVNTIVHAPITCCLLYTSDAADD